MVSMRRRHLPAAAVPLMWGYEGFWCKVFPGRADQRAIVEGMPLLPGGAVTPLLLAIGLAEVALGLWVLTGRRPYAAAAVQTVLVTGFNTGGLLFGAEHIPEPGRLDVQDAAFLALIWLVAEPIGTAPGGMVPEPESSKTSTVTVSRSPSMRVPGSATYCTLSNVESTVRAQSPMIGQTVPWAPVVVYR